MTVQIFTGDANIFEQQQQEIRRSTLEFSVIEPQKSMRTDRWLIVGAGGFGREVYSWTLGHLHSNGDGSSIGFLDDNPECLDKFPNLRPLWSERISTYCPRPGDRLLMAIADPGAKLAAGSMLISRGATFASYIHPTAVLSHDFQIGKGCILCPLSVVCCNVRIGDFVSMNVGALAGHDSVIDEGCTLSPHANVAGQVDLERGVFLGCQTVILPKIRIGEFARIGAGSTVISHVRSHSTMMGVPAKRVSWSKSQEYIDQKAA